MRGNSETEEYLQRLFQPFVDLVRRMVGLWVFQQFGRLLTFLASPFLPVWNRYWSFIHGDDIPVKDARVPGFMQKATYQRSALVIWPILIVCVVIISLGILSQEPTMVTITNGRMPVTVVDMYVPDQNSATDTSAMPGARTNVPKLVEHGSGFLGLVNLRPVGQDLPEPLFTLPSEIYAVGHFADFDEDQPISFSPVEGDLDTVIIPADVDFEWTEIIPDTEPKPKLVNRGPILIYKVSAKVPPSAKMMGMGGYVEVLALIGPDGNYAYFTAHAVDTVVTYPEFIFEVVIKGGTTGMLEFYIDADSSKNQLLLVKLEDDSSPEFKFAEYLYEVLPEWKFGPPLYNSKPTYAFVRIRYNFCAPDDVECIEIILNSVHSSAS